MFPNVSSKQSFPELEAAVTAYWKEHQTFRKSVEQRPEENPYRFYDGPPFITGTPHYGSLLSSIVKDIVGRYWTMQGKRVERVWGWDCHGLPIEEKVQKKLGINSNKEIEKVGVKQFIDECYNYTAETSAEWGWYIDRIGRWVDMDKAYRTMDQDYMESVMWVFSELYRKGLVYEGKRVSLYSWKLGTPISNFEVAMDDSYQEVNDPAITVKFRVSEKQASIGWVRDEQGRYLLGWSNKYAGWHFVGGACEAGESPETTLIREMEEEIGVKVSQESLQQVAEESQFDTGVLWKATHFEVQIHADELRNGEPEKFREWKWFTQAELAGIYQETYELDRRILDMMLWRIPLQKKAPSVYILAWTTTPWTMPANMALAVGADIEYVLVEQEGEQYIVAKNRAESVFKGKGEYQEIQTYTGAALEGVRYTPPFPEYYHQSSSEKNHRVYTADFATDTDGTGVVHCAPEFGDVDFELAKAKGIRVTNALDEEGKYTTEISDLGGTFYSDANEIMMHRLTERGLLFKKESITHRIPFCPRSGTPLIQKAQNSWFIDIANNKEKLKAANEQIYWFPEHLKHGRFAKGIDSAPDWCISRTRYWGAPMPVWLGRDASGVVRKQKVFGSRAEIEAASGMKIENLHKPYIDDIRWTEYDTELAVELHYTRIPEVLDVWMDSGSMPYAQMHYPFENKEAMEASFPADFIAEYVGQVRAWFYVMHVLGVLLNPKNDSEPMPAFKNVITTGVIYGTDGRKMSKSFKNYPDPRGTIEAHGADGIRFYLTNTPLMTGGDINFTEEGITDAIKRVVLPLWNTYSFFTTYANIDGWSPAKGKHYFMRHGQTDANLQRRLSDGFDDSPLNETGREQAKQSGQALRAKNTQFDVIFASPLVRARETAEIVAREIWFTGEIQMIPDLIERKSGKYSGMPLADIVEQHFQETGERVELSNAGSIYFGDASVESEAQFCERVGKWLQTELPKYADKRVLVVAHGGVFRAVTHYFEHIPYEIAFNRKYFPTLPNAAYVELPHTPRVNPMDRWIIGELQTLNAKVQNAYEKYDLQTMARSILDFMDDLTNWYVRRSRRRFWKSETDMDKASAYETLYRVLQEVCQIAAPVIPFVTEHIYRGLTEKESVHLEFFPEWNRFAVPQDITSDMALTKQLVSLGLALRGRKKLRVRQPLASVTIGVVLPEYFIDILKEELNVKEVFQGADMSQVAKLVCRPNARLIGPRFGKQVQEIIVSAKSGAFTLLDDGSVQVGDAVLAVGEFELVYEPISSEFDVEGGGGQVILMDTCITQALRDEGIARDAVRTIQDLRKEADYAVSDRVELFISGGQEIREALEKNREYILGETLADNLFFEETDTSDIQTGVMFEETEVKFALKRVAR